MARRINSWPCIVGFILAIECVSLIGCNHTTPPAEGGPAKPTPTPLKPRGAPPRLVLDESSHNFGTMDQQQIGKHVFKIRNEGEGPLDLRFVNTSCGCTSVKLGDLLWNPKDGSPPRNLVTAAVGETIDVELKWDTELRSGDFRTVAQIESSDPKHQRLDLSIEGNILSFVELSQGQVRVEDGRNNEVSVAFVHIFSKKLEDLEVTEVKSSNDKITAEITPAEDTFLSAMEAKSGKRVTIKIEPGLPIGPFNASLTLLTSYEPRGEMTVSVTGNIVGEISLTPEDKIDFGLIPTSEATTRGLFLKVRSDSPVNVKVSRTIPEFLKVTLTPMGSETSKNRFQLKVQVPQGSPGGNFKGGIELETDHPTAKFIKIPVRGQIGRTR